MEKLEQIRKRNREKTAKYRASKKGQDKEKAYRQTEGRKKSTKEI